MSMSVSSSTSGSFATSGPFSSTAATGQQASVQPTEKESVESQFLKIARQSPVERMRAAILKRMGLTEEDLKAMSPQARAEVEKAIREEIAKQMKANGDKSTGLLTDIAA